MSEQEKMYLQEGLCKLVGHKSNSPDDCNFLLGEYGRLRVTDNSMVFAIGETGVRSGVSCFEIMHRETRLEQGVGMVGSLRVAIVELDFEQEILGVRHVFRFQGEETYMIRLFDSIGKKDRGQSKHCFVASTVYGDPKLCAS